MKADKQLPAASSPYSEGRRWCSRDSQIQDRADGATLGYRVEFDQKATRD